MKICPIRSGSKGNAVLIFTEKTKLLIDCGISGKTVEKGMKNIGVDPAELSAILITHEHNDHIKGVGVMTRRYNIPVYANQKTWDAMEKLIGSINQTTKRIIKNNREKIGDIKISAFSIPHDAADPVGYCVESENKKASVATDIGVLNESIFKAVKGSSTVFLEANHDRNMLDAGRYPYNLKQRIKGEKGHLSNDEAGLAAKYLFKMGARNIILGHLSSENNYPLLAKNTVVNILNEAGIKANDDISVSVASDMREGKVITV